MKIRAGGAGRGIGDGRSGRGWVRRDGGAGGAGMRGEMAGLVDEGMAWCRQCGEVGRGAKGRGKKRPSVETEGRLTIACHMKILQKIDVDDGAGCTSGTKIMTRTYSENISMIPNG